MKIEVECVKNLVCSQVFSWKLECSKAEWDDSGRRLLFNLPEGHISTNVFKQFKSGKPKGVLELWEGTKNKGVRKFIFHFVPETDKKFEHQVSVKVRDESKLLVTLELTDVLQRGPDDKWTKVGRARFNSSDYLSYK